VHRLGWIALRCGVQRNTGKQGAGEQLEHFHNNPPRLQFDVFLVRMFNA
jgi:hypothetical protein